MRVNVYAEEMTDRIEIISKEINGQKFTGVRFYLYLPVTQNKVKDNGPNKFAEKEEVQIKGPFIHGEADDDSSAVTFWGKQDLRGVLVKALQILDHYYELKEE